MAPRRAAVLTGADLDREVAAVVVLGDCDAMPLPALREAGVRVERVRRRGSLPGVLARLDAAGVPPGLVLVVSTKGPVGVPSQVRHVAGSEVAIRDLLSAVLCRAAEMRVPDFEDDPEWVLTEIDQGPQRHRVSEAVLTVGAGAVATRGSLEERPAGAAPLVLAAGIYAGAGSEQHLLPLPDWTHLDASVPAATRRRSLDLRTGVLHRSQTGEVGVPLRTARFASSTLPGVMLLRAEGPAGVLHAGPPLVGAAADVTAGDTATALARAVTGGVAVAAWQRCREDGPRHCVERVAAYAPSRHRRPAAGAAGDLLERARDSGYERLLAEHRAEWARRWESVDVRVPDDPEVQLAARWALFQLWSQTAAVDELAVGARGLSGAAYAGHVFWDADVFVLPALASVNPAAARAMVRYRTRRLAGAKHAARCLGAAGARFPWEAAADGSDVTPTAGRLGGEQVAIYTGSREEHITADVAWGAAFCSEWAGRTITPSSAPGRLLLETARYWHGRPRLGTDGRAHIDGVIGPDEYHEDVDDNAYTNVMARWNLRRGAQLLARAGSGEEAAAWNRTAEALADNLDLGSGRYEQFAGYDRLEPLTVADLGTVPVAADLLLGPERVAGSQLIKQPDVLMLHLLVPDEVAPGSLLPNLDFYGPRTAHGSSLSPSVTATLLARAGRPDEARQMLRLAQSIDLADLTGTTSGGLHMANVAGIWRCLLAGFAGAGVRNGALLIDPVLPSGWRRLELRFRVLGRTVRLDIDERRTVLRADGPLSVTVPGRAPCHLAGRGEVVLPGGRH